MANSYKALTLALFLCLGTTAAHAGYAQAKPPQGWSTSGFNGPKAANNTSYYPGGVRTSPTINVGGKTITMPANLRFAANAPRFAGAVLFANPYIRGAAAIAGWLGVAGLVYDAASGLWQKPDENEDFKISDGFKYCSNMFGGCADSLQQVVLKDLRIFPNSPSYDGTWFMYAGVYISHSLEPVPNSDGVYILKIVNFRNSSNYVNTATISKSGSSSCPAGWYVTPAGCVQTPPVKTVSEEEFLDALTQHPMPAEVPRYIPAPLPVELPEIAPAFVPTGNPLPNPDYDPQAEPSPQNQPYFQPGVRVVPAPTPSSPWQVDLQPVNRPAQNPEPSPEPEIGPLPEPGTNPGTNPPGPPGETPVTPALCDQYPDILACQKLEEPEEEKLEFEEKDLGGDFEIMGGFAGSATCPAFPQIDMLPGLSWQPFCDQLARIRPLVLAFAWLSAVMIILKYGRK